MRLDEYPDVLEPQQVAEILGISRNACYAAIKAGSIPAFRIGKLIRVSRASLRRLFASGAAGARKSPRSASR